MRGIDHAQAEYGSNIYCPGSALYGESDGGEE
jgi:hypothetical protein